MDRGDAASISSGTFFIVHYYNHEHYLWLIDSNHAIFSHIIEPGQSVFIQPRVQLTANISGSKA